MKKRSILTVSIFLLFACSKDETTNSCGFKESSFIGKWKATKVEIAGRDTTTALFTLMPCYKTLITEFKANKVVSQTNSGKDLFGAPCEKLEDQNWKIFSLNNKNYMVMYSQNSSDTSIINSITCSNIVSTRDQITFTLTKQ